MVHDLQPIFGLFSEMYFFQALPRSESAGQAFCVSCLKRLSSPLNGLDQMPAIDTSIACQMVSPDEALRPDACCQGLLCRITEDLLTKSYDIAAWMG